MDKVIDNASLFASVESVLGEGGRVRIRVKGNSMRPFLRDGRDTAVLAPLQARRLRRGMLLLFRYRGQVILHRLRHTGHDHLTAAGDGNYRASEYPVREDVIGYAEAIEKNGRTIKYLSARWRMLSAVSLTRAAIRRTVLDILGAVRRTNAG